MSNQGVSQSPDNYLGCLDLTLSCANGMLNQICDQAWKQSEDHSRCLQATDIGEV